MKIKVFYKITNQTKHKTTYGECIFSGDNAYNELAKLRNKLDKEGAYYRVYIKKFLRWRPMYTINMLDS